MGCNSDQETQQDGAESDANADRYGAAQAARKRDAGDDDEVFAVAGFIVSLILLTRVNRDLPLSITYPTWGRLGIVGASVEAAARFGKRLAMQHWLGAAVIIVGIALMFAPWRLFGDPRIMKLAFYVVTAGALATGVGLFVALTVAGVAVVRLPSFTSARRARGDAVEAVAQDRVAQTIELSDANLRIG
ncbi:DMT family transporter [Bosea thiooxidans]